MKIKGMHWGYDGGGIACGPVEGSVNVEVIVQDDHGRLHFVLVSQFMDFFQIMVSPFSLFDSFMLINSDGLDAEHLSQTTEAICTECYDFEGDEYPKELMESEYLDVFRFAFHAMDAFDPFDLKPGQSAAAYIEAYLNEDAKNVQPFPLPWESSSY